MRGVDPGCRTDHLLTASVELPDAAYPSAEKTTVFYRELLERVRALPGVSAAGLVSNPPLSGHFSDEVFNVDGRPPLPPGQYLDAVDLSADPAYFRVAGIPLLRGRTFTDADGPSKTRSVVVISQGMARKFWPGENPLGQFIRMGSIGPRYEVIGVVGDVCSRLGAPPEETMYFPALANGQHRMFVFIRTAGPPEAMAGSVRAAVRELDPQLALHDVATMEEKVAAGAADQRYTFLLLGSLAVLALLLAAIGLYGVMSYAVVQRTPEIGVRMALGAQRSDVVSMVVAHGLKPVAAGVVLGLAAAAGCARWLESLLYSVKPGDPVTFAAVAVLLAAVAVAACAIPALRAMRVDPVRSLRSE